MQGIHVLRVFVVQVLTEQSLTKISILWNCLIFDTFIKNHNFHSIWKEHSFGQPMCLRRYAIRNKTGNQKNILYRIKQYLWELESQRRVDLRSPKTFSFGKEVDRPHLLLDVFSFPENLISVHASCKPLTIFSAIYAHIALRHCFILMNCQLYKHLITFNIAFLISLYLKKSP